MLIPSPPAASGPLKVSQLNSRVRLLLEDIFVQVWVEGEISNLARPASGHIYFSLKDARTQVRCALFRQAALKVQDPLSNGLQVRVRGKVSLFEGRGDYQLILEQVESSGAGDLRQAYETLKARLDAEGLFAQSHKQPLPAYPRQVGIITSASGAVLQDILSIFRRRAPQVALTLIPSTVQGSTAVPQLLAALRRADAAGFDALILARGGGSLEDLWCFNEEALVRAIATCKTPVVSAVGHETDVTLSDFAADLRAPTPSAAAELLAPQRTQLQQQLFALEQRLHLSLSRQLQSHRQHLEQLQQGLRHPQTRLQQQSLRLDNLRCRLQPALGQQLQQRREHLARLELRLRAHGPTLQLAAQQQQLTHCQQRLHHALQEHLKGAHQRLQQQLVQLQHLSPLATLTRGYSILKDAQGQVIQTPSQTQPGQILEAHLAEGRLSLQVLAKKN